MLQRNTNSKKNIRKKILHLTFYLYININYIETKSFMYF